MPYPPQHHATTRERIIRSAQALFNRRGFTAVSIDDVMEHAGLTRGGFYAYFRAKSDLYVEAVAKGWSQWSGVSGNLSASEAAKQLIDAYLSRKSFDDIDTSCPMVTLPGDVARSGQVVKRAFEGVFIGMVQVFEEALRREGRPDATLPLAIVGMCVGAMVVSRSVEDPQLADGIRAAARQAALELGGWRDSDDAASSAIARD